MQTKGTEQFGLLGVFVTFCAIIALSFFIDLEMLKEVVVGSGPWAPLVFILLKISTVVIAPLGGGPLYPLVGAFFGYWPGILYVAIGDLIGFTIAFLLSRFYGYPLVMRLTAKGQHEMLRKIVDHASTTKGFLQMVLAFFAVPELIAYGTGLSRYPFLPFILVLWPLTWIGSSILVLVGSTLGASSESLLLAFALPSASIAITAIGLWVFFRSLKKQ